MKRFVETMPTDNALNELRYVRNHSPISRLTAMMMAALLALFQVFPPAASAQSTGGFNRNFKGAIDFSGAGPVRPFVVSGTAPNLGQFECHGEAEFRTGETEGSLFGEGVAVFKAANGDLLVGVVTWAGDPEGTGTGVAVFHWRDSVQFSDGTVVSSTGRFVENKPPGFIISVEMLFITVILVIGFAPHR